ncbi:MAG: cytochrome c [Nitrospirae bacterium]|nr:cytochrome c [Nitrospirota bacterium]MBF0590770.1 cytochrome c [Nitrospirota bacterium]
MSGKGKTTTRALLFTINQVAMVVTLLLLVCGQDIILAMSERDNMPVPMNQSVFYYPGVNLPVVSTVPATLKPIGISTLANGGNTVNVRIATGAFLGAVDMYFGVSAPALGSEVLLLRADGTLQGASKGVFPWRTNTLGNINASLFGDIAVSNLPEGSYTLYLLIVPSGGTAYAFDNHYLYVTDFAISHIDGAPLYAQNCAACHGTNAEGKTGTASNIQGKTPQDIKTAIIGVSSMAYLKTLTENQINAIAIFLASKKP